MATRSTAAKAAPVPTTNTIEPTEEPTVTAIGKGRGRSALVEKMLDDRGVLYDFYDEFDLSLIDVVKSQHNQARIMQPINKEQADIYKEAMIRGDQFPAIVIYPQPSGKYIVVDGNHRVEAALAAKRPIGAYVLDKRTKTDLITRLTYEANTKHGLPASPQERARHAVWLIQNVQSTIKEAAASMNLPAHVVSRHYSISRADDRADRLKVAKATWDDVNTSVRQRLNSITSDEVFLAVVDLVWKARLNAAEVDEVVAEIRAIGATGDQLAYVQRWTEDNRDRIAGVLTGDVNPRRQHGWGGPRWSLRSSIYQVESLKDADKRTRLLDQFNPVEATEWMKRIDEAIKVYQSIKKDLEKVGHPEESK